MKFTNIEWIKDGDVIITLEEEHRPWFGKPWTEQRKFIGSGTVWRDYPTFRMNWDSDYDYMLLRIYKREKFKKENPEKASDFA